jgi:predicted nucleotidyltransferase
MKSKKSILKTIHSHKAKLARFGVLNIGLFGSYVRDEQSECSDIDILIDFDKNEEKFDNLMAVCDLLENLFENEKIDVVTKNGSSPYIGPRILNEVMYV